MGTKEEESEIQLTGNIVTTERRYRYLQMRITNKYERLKDMMASVTEQDMDLLDSIFDSVHDDKIWLEALNNVIMPTMTEAEQIKEMEIMDDLILKLKTIKTRYDRIKTRMRPGEQPAAVNNCQCQLSSTMKYDAVKIGRIPNVHTNWVDAKKNVDKCSNADFRKFLTENEAINCVGIKNSVNISSVAASSSGTKNSCNDVPLKLCTCICQCGAYPNVPLSTVKLSEQDAVDSKEIIDLSSDAEPPHKLIKQEHNAEPPHKLLRQEHTEESVIPIDLDKPIHVFTNGACSGNGRMNSNGIGVYWGPNHPWNISEPLYGRRTNHRAEIMAAVRALQKAKSVGVKNIIINSDSQFLINGITNWIFKWKRNGWKLSTGGTVVNKEDFEALDEAQKGLTVQYKYVPGHEVIHGNEEANRLAELGRDLNK